jgi:hypothetical protein
MQFHGYLPQDIKADTVDESPVVQIINDALVAKENSD